MYPVSLLLACGAALAEKPLLVWTNIEEPEIRAWCKQQGISAKVDCPENDTMTSFYLTALSGPDAADMLGFQARECERQPLMDAELLEDLTTHPAIRERLESMYPAFRHMLG